MTGGRRAKKREFSKTIISTVGGGHDRRDRLHLDHGVED